MLFVDIKILKMNYPFKVTKLCVVELVIRY